MARLHSRRGWRRAPFFALGFLGLALPGAATEGPAADAAGNVYYCDGARIIKRAPDGTKSVFRENGVRTNGLVFDSQFRLLAAEMGDRTGETPSRVTLTEIAAGKYEVLADHYAGRRFNSLNDITVDGKGRIYFTDSGYKPADAKMGASGVYRIDPDGKLTRILSAPEVDTPNGLIISSADGMCIDVEGNLYMAAGLNKLRNFSETLDTKPVIHVYSPAGKLLRLVPISQDLITNCTFGGPEMKTLYVTAGRDLLEFRNTAPGTRR
jgi:gluconolactonase